MGAEWNKARRRPLEAPLLNPKALSRSLSPLSAGVGELIQGLTTEAVALYRRHLKPGGILAVHVTNRYLDLAPVVQQLAVHAGLSSVLIISPSDPYEDVNRADWVLVSESSGFFSRPEVAAVGKEFSVHKDLRLWTDDYNSLLPVVRWKPREEPSY